MAAVKAMTAEIQKITKLKAEGGKTLLAEHGYRGNQPKMALRGLRSFLMSEDSLFPDLLEKFEAGKLSPYKLAESARQRTEKIGTQEVIIHSDTIHHANPLELGDAFDEMPPDELRDFLTEEFEVEGETYGDSKLSRRGQSYTSRGHLGQTTNPRGRYKATNEFSEPGLTEISSHPRGANDPLMKAPDVKPTTREEAKAFVRSKSDIIKESRILGAYADKDVRDLANKKVTERGIILPNNTIYDPNLPDDTLKQVRESLDNITDETDLAKAFKTPKPTFLNGKAMFSQGLGGIMGFLTNQEATTKLGQGDVSGAIESGAKDFLVGETISQVTQRYILPRIAPRIVQGVASFGMPVAAAVAAVAGLDGATRIGNNGVGLVGTGKEAQKERDETIKTDGMTSARRQFRRSTK